MSGSAADGPGVGNGAEAEGRAAGEDLRRAERREDGLLAPQLLLPGGSTRRAACASHKRAGARQARCNDPGSGITAKIYYTLSKPYLLNNFLALSPSLRTKSSNRSYLASLGMVFKLVWLPFNSQYGSIPADKQCQCCCSSELQ